MRLAYRCPKRFDDLDGDGLVRGCRACGKPVVDLSVLSEDEARAYVRDHPGTCGRMLRTADGRWLRQAAQLAAASVLVAAEPCTSEPAPVEVPVPSVVLPAPDPPAPPVSPNRTELRIEGPIKEYELLGYVL